MGGTRNRDSSMAAESKREIDEKKIERKESGEPRY